MSTDPTQDPPDAGDSSTPPPPAVLRGQVDTLADLMAEGDLPPVGQVDTVSTTRDDRRRQPTTAHGKRRLHFRTLLAFDLIVLVAVIVWPLGSPSLDALPELRRVETFAIGDQGLVEQAIAQAAAGRYDAAIVDLELHLSSHPRLGATERELVNRALAIFAARAGRPDDAAAFEARLGARPELTRLLDQAAADERAGRFEQMRARLVAIAEAGDAPASILARVAEMLLRSGDGTPLEPTRTDAQKR